MIKQSIYNTVSRTQTHKSSLVQMSVYSSLETFFSLNKYKHLYTSEATENVIHYFMLLFSFGFVLVLLKNVNFSRNPHSGSGDTLSVRYHDMEENKGPVL